MLGKLLKYEIKATARMFLPIYLILLVVATINKFAIVLLPETPITKIVKGLAMAAFVAVIIGVIAMCFIVLIQRFYKNLLTEEGYLMFTLPVKASSLILSKGIISLMWVISSVIIVALSIIIIIPDYSIFSQIPVLLDSIRRQASTLDINFDLMVWLFLILIIISGMTFVIEVYTALSFGQLVNDHKLGTSFGAYVVIYIIGQAVSSALLMAIMGITQGFDLSGAIFDIKSFLYSVMGMSFGISIAFTVAGFFITRYILKNKLNLS